MEAKFEDKPKRGLFISHKVIRDRSFKEKYKSTKLFIYSLKNPININYEEYLILETRDAKFYIWASKEDKIDDKVRSIKDNLILYFDTAKIDDNQIKDLDIKLYTDSAIFIYLLFRDLIILNSYCYYYKIIINSLSKILRIYSIIPVKRIQNEISLFKNDDIWINFFNWLHEIEPSFLYSFFLYQYLNSKGTKDKKDKKDKKDRVKDFKKFKMPALNFTPYFFAKCPQLANAILKDYNAYMRSNRFTPETYLISVSPFFSIEFVSKIDYEKGKIPKDNIIFIIKGRLNQSSHASELNIKCFKKHVNLFKDKIDDFKDINDLFDPKHQQNLLALESIDSKDDTMYDQIDPERDENIVYFGLPSPISLKTNQDYFNFNNKQVYMNYPLELTGNAQLNYQVRSIKRTFKLDENRCDNLNFLILTDEAYSNMLKCKNSILFRYLIRKFSDTKVPLQFGKDHGFNQNELIESSFHSIFNMEKFHTFYKFPFSLYSFRKLLDKYLEENKSNITSEEQIDINTMTHGSKSTSNLQEDKESPSPKTEPKNKKPKENNIHLSQSTMHFEALKNEVPLFFFTKPNIPYFIIDSVSNFINRIFTYYNFHVENKSIEFFDVQYIKKKLLEDTNIDTHQNDIKELDEKHIENIIKAALFAILFCRFHSIFKDASQITFLPQTHILFLFIFYKVEKAKTNNNERLDEKMNKAYKYIQTIPEITVIELTKLYFCHNQNNANKNNQNNDNKNNQNNANKNNQNNDNKNNQNLEKDNEEEDSEKKKPNQNKKRNPIKIKTKFNKKRITNKDKSKESPKKKTQDKSKESTEKETQDKSKESTEKETQDKSKESTEKETQDKSKESTEKETQDKSKESTEKETQDQDQGPIIEENKKYYSPPPYLKDILEQFLNLF